MPIVSYVAGRCETCGTERKAVPGDRDMFCIDGVNKCLYCIEGFGSAMEKYAVANWACCSLCWALVSDLPSHHETCQPNCITCDICRARVKPDAHDLHILREHVKWDNLKRKPLRSDIEYCKKFPRSNRNHKLIGKGKFSGKPLKDIPPNYQKWILGQVGWPQWDKDMIKGFLMTNPI